MTQFTTPWGRKIEIECRPGTADSSITAHVIAHDEYRLESLLAAPVPGGVVLDVGAYIGAWSVMVALELRPELVIAIEPVMENVAQIAVNAALNHVHVVPQRFAASKQEFAEIRYRYDDQYAYVGNMYDGQRDAEIHLIPGLSLSTILETVGINQIGLLKIDCEGCEHDFLDDPAVENVYRIVGEIHGDPDPLYERLLPTHHFEMREFIFTATKR